MSEELVNAALQDVINDLDSPHSRRSYASDWNRYCEWAAEQGIDVLAATPRVIRDHTLWMRDTKGYKRSTVGKALSVIREVYRALVNAEVIAINPASATKNPKADHALKTPVLTEQEMRHLISSMPMTSWREGRDRLVVLCLFGLGWRRAEVARMRVEDFDGTTVRAIVKGNKAINVAVPTWLLEEITAWREMACIFAGPLFPRRELGDRPISGPIVYEIVTAVAKAAGFPAGAVTPHAMRRTNITIAGEKGVSLKARQLAVGHSSSSTTERYDRARDARSEAPGNAFAEIVGAA